MTHLAKLKRALIKANTPRGHHHPSYQNCDEICIKQTAKVEDERTRLQARVDKLRSM